ncbi:TonB-dependent receptor [Pedobacter sp. SYSU D00535]|uniref:TonB-dependent receptor n=1 Tax=Pedobacter sp. SYSU D00535 TaxID=2810308 RepID=UPI001A9778F5|nr:TonB-dependent receptor [Pedobacter sp. SYSU D00535]
MRSFQFLLFLILYAFHGTAQTATVHGSVKSVESPVPFATIKIENQQYASSTDSAGRFQIRGITTGKHTFRVSALGFLPASKTLLISEGDSIKLEFELKSDAKNLNEVVVSGTLKEVNRLESAVPVEVYSPAFFRKNPTPSIFEALQNVNGVRPQINCNICNTGDIHINGLEGPYTMVLIDGMPIVSSLSTVYGLSGIPNSLVERMEVVKGPASSLYGSEAVGGLINIITKKPSTAPVFSADVFSTTWNEINTDLGFKFKAGKANVLSGLNYFNYQNPEDRNRDNFTDVTLQHRISAFQKWSFNRDNNRLFSLAGRYFYEDRWGGEMNWKPAFRGGSTVYGESIYTKRWELLGNYQLPVKEKLLFSFSYNHHDQNSVYGLTSYQAKQHVAFSQLTLDKKIHNHDLLVGAAVRYTLYDDNTPATGGELYQPDKVWLPGVFVQDEISLSAEHSVLAGLRYDHNSRHGDILTPRFAWKWKLNDENLIRLNAGTGFRVVNLFTEDHAALTGARTVEILEDLRPEKSYNVNLNYIKKIYTKNNDAITFDFSGWYTYFNNRIIADYESHPDKIIYDNLDGFAVSNGLSANLEFSSSGGVKILSGFTLMDVFTVESTFGDRIRQRQMLTEPWMGTWAVTVPIKKTGFSVDYTGNIYGPMRLPVLENDPRRTTSPIWSLQNIQLTFASHRGFEIYGGLKNLLNWTPNRSAPFLIAGSDDPFGEEFDTTYVYAPNQGLRGFFGMRLTIKK